MSARPSRRELPPLEKRDTPETIRARATLEEILPEVQVHFPHLEEDLRRDHGIGFEIFKDDREGALGLLLFSVQLARYELNRRLRFAADHLYSQISEDQAERLAIQTEGSVSGQQSARPG